MFATSKVAGAVATAATYIEDVFSTYVRNGTSPTGVTVNTGIDGTKGCLIWAKARNANSLHLLNDTQRGLSYVLSSNNTNAQTSSGYTNYITSVTTSGIVFGSQDFGTTETVVHWQFRKQPKFFDIVTYTGNGVSGRQISHSLASTPGCIIVKSTSNAENWAVWHRSNSTFCGTDRNIMYLNSTAGVSCVPASTAYFLGASSTTFTVGNNNVLNGNGLTYVAYLFAHDAGGFGPAGTDNVISCGSFTTDASANATVNLGYEPQWMLVKCSSAVEEWRVVDNMRGFTASGGTQPTLYPDQSSSEGNAGFGNITSTGLQTSSLSANSTYIYIAIRRGPMKTPTSGTSVFTPVAYSGTGSNNTVTSGFPTDFVIEGNRASATSGTKFGMWDRLRAANYWLSTSTAAEVAAGTAIVPASPWDSMTGMKVGTTSTLTNASGNTFAYWMFKRAPQVLDTICYTGNGTTNTRAHNLGVAPELIIVKRRDVSVADANFDFLFTPTTYSTCQLGSTGAASVNDYVSYDYAAAPNSTSIFLRGSGAATNANGSNYVMELFASCPGVSKVGTYTGTGAAQTINCGFSSGARFVLLKAVSTTSSYAIFDTARGIVVGSDPLLYLNLTNAETSADVLSPQSVGFGLAGSSYNLSGQTYLYLAIA